MDSDRLAVKQILGGNTECYSSLVNKYYPRLISFIIKMGVIREDAEDITQDVFEKVYNNLYKYNPKWNFSTWLFNIAVNTYKDFKKKKKIKTEDLSDFGMANSGFSTEEHMDSIYQRELIKQMLCSVDDEVRAMMILYYYQGMTLKEIGDIYRLSPEAVKMKIFRARSRLSKTYNRSLTGGESYEM